MIDLKRYRARAGELLVVVDDLDRVAPMVSNHFGQRVGSSQVRPSGLVYGRDVAVPMGYVLAVGRDVTSVAPGDRIVMAQEVLGQLEVELADGPVRCQRLRGDQVLAIEQPGGGYFAPGSRVVGVAIDLHTLAQAEVTERHGRWHVTWRDLGWSQTYATEADATVAARSLVVRDQVKYFELMSVGPDAARELDVGDVVVTEATAGFTWTDGETWVSLEASTAMRRIPLRGGQYVSEPRSELLGVVTELPPGAVTAEG